jgi:hypothetical protein
MLLLRRRRKRGGGGKEEEEEVGEEKGGGGRTRWTLSATTRRRRMRSGPPSFLSGCWQPRTSPRTCPRAQQSRLLYRHSILPWCQYILVPTASHVHLNFRLLLLLSAFSWPGASDSAHSLCHPISLLLLPIPLYRPPYTPYSCHAIPRAYT